MRKRYRILKTDYSTDDYEDVVFTIQKKSWLGFWYLPYRINGHFVKAYSSIDSLEKDIDLMLSTPKKKIVYEVYVDKGDIVWVEL